MNIHLGDTFERYVRTQLAGGRYNNASEVIRDALRLKMQADEIYAAKLEALRRDIDLAGEQVRAGETVPFDLETFLSRPHRADG
ncbi:MAG: type II toxin-antitoxin system ParD family antitoxin [Proteobacteria bacterium]|nr:type II toxin-antitoxin system ParD family antitoxin [Pseudomonadota bacterium]